MSDPWPVEPLATVLTPVERPERIQPEKLYRLLGAHWYGNGLYIKEIKSGSQIQADRLYEVSRGDFVYNRLFGWKGSFAVVGPEHEGCYVSGEFPCFRIETHRLEPQFLRWYFAQSATWDKALGLSTGGTPTSRNRLKADKLLGMRMPLPPLEEQRRIVAVIERLAGKIEEARELRRQAAAQVERMLASVVSHLTFREDQWGTVALAVSSKRGAVRSGPFGSQLHHAEFVPSGVAAIGTRDVRVNRLMLNGGWYVAPEKFEQFKRYQVFPGDILVTIVGASIGRFCVVPDDVPEAFTTKHIQALTLDRNRAVPEFASYMLNFHARCRDGLFSHVEGSAQPSLNASKILATPLVLPSVIEQTRIVEYLDDMQVALDRMQRLQSETSAELDALLPAVLDRAFRGNL
jgi:type I restriction enzyme, S subunit